MPKRGGLSGLTLLALAAGAVVTVILAVAARIAYDDNEDRLLRQSTQEAARVIEAAVPVATTPLNQVATLVRAAEETGSLPSDVVRAGVESVLDDSPYAHLSVWQEGADEPVRSVGDTKLDVTSEVVAGWFADMPAADEDPLRIVDLLQLPDPRVGYVYAVRSPGPFVIYGERPTPADRQTNIGRGEAFVDIDFVLYLGDEPRPDHVISTTRPDQQLDGRTASEQIPLGDTVMLLVVSPNRRLGGNVLAQLPWQVAAGGLASTAVGAALVELLHRRRRDAEVLASEVEDLYGREHAIAHTLQHSLLPRELPVVAGAELAVRYLPGAQGTEVGGDWYDVVDLDDRRLCLVVGDVAGKGVQAAAVMAAMRYATHAIAAQGVAPDRILSQVNHLEGIRGDFVTMVCAVLDLRARTLSVSRAGHPPPLLVTGGRARFVGGHSGPPVGFLDTSQYVTETIPLERGTTVVLYTDGLYERPGEDLDVGLDRLRRTVESGDGPLQAMVDVVAEEMVGDRARDDVALLAVRLDPPPEGG